MDADTIGTRVKRARSCQCPTCKDCFTSRKARHTHQMQAHRNLRRKPVMIAKKLVSASELYR